MPLCLFVTEAELETIVHNFAFQRQLVGCLQIGNDLIMYEPIVEPGAFRTTPQVVQFFLFPKDQIQPIPFTTETALPRFRGWIHIRPGHLKEVGDQQILTMTTLDAEDHHYLPFKPMSWIRQLKKRLSSTITFEVSLGSRIYKDIGYSQEALVLYRQGVRWMQYVTNKSEFHPISTEERAISCAE